MSFRDNLQHLRATRNMTQEQLAMLLGVSRQSVTKWEAERSYPEMDKLLKLCQIFDCTLDDLVQGDLTARAAEPSQATVPAGPPTDVCGYDEHQRRIARQIPTGIAAIILGCGVGMLFEGESLLGMSGDALMIATILIGVLVGCAFLIPAGMEHSAFMKAHPYIEDFYTEDDRAQARRALARALIAGLACIFIGAVCIIVLGEARETERLGLFLLLAFIALGVWLIVRYGMLLGRTNIAEYNRSTAEELEIKDIMNAQIDEELRATMLERKRRDEKLAAICGIIMIIATIVALILLFAPVFSTGDPSSFEPLGTSASWFWMAWVVGGLICGIVALVMHAFGQGESR